MILRDLDKKEALKLLREHKWLLKRQLSSGPILPPLLQRSTLAIAGPTHPLLSASTPAIPSLSRAIRDAFKVVKLEWFR